MKFKVPKVAAVLQFLFEQGWTLEGDYRYDYFVQPPEWMQPRFSQRYELRIPHPEFEKAQDYPLLMDSILNNISIIHQISRKSLEDLLSPTPDDAVIVTAKKRERLAEAA